MQINNFGTSVQSLKSNADASAPFGQAVSNAAQERNLARKTETSEPAQTTVSTESITENPLDQVVPADVQRNQRIVEATLSSVELSSGKRPEQLTLKVVIEEINIALEKDLGPRAIESSVESGLDVSPEATAERIVSLSTGMFGAFSDANPDLKGDALVDRFVEVIGSGIETGFAQAREILDGLGVLGGDIGSNVDATYERVQQKLEEFRQAHSTASNIAVDASSDVDQSIDELNP